MKILFPRIVKICPALAVALLGCASPDVNPRTPKANTGYVDFYSPTKDALYWDVKRSKSANGYKTVFSKLNSVDAGVLRLAFSPGRHKFRVTFLNRVINKPVEIEVDVQNGKITPVRITLTEGRNVVVQSSVQVRGGSAYGRNGQRIKVVSDESVMYDVSAVAGAPEDYQRRERMPYAH